MRQQPASVMFVVSCVGTLRTCRVVISIRSGRHAWEIGIYAHIRLYRLPPEPCTSNERSVAYQRCGSVTGEIRGPTPILSGRLVSPTEDGRRDQSRDTRSDQSGALRTRVRRPHGTANRGRGVGDERRDSLPFRHERGAFERFTSSSSRNLTALFRSSRPATPNRTSRRLSTHSRRFPGRVETPTKNAVSLRTQCGSEQSVPGRPRELH